MTKCRACSEELTPENTSPSFLKRGFTICRKCNQKDVSDRIYTRKYEILQRLGGQCICCGENNIMLLSIDHINGGGHKERRDMKSWAKYIKTLYHMTIDQLKTKYQCLCFNCNYCAGFWDRCIHKVLQYTNQPLIIVDRGVKQTHLSNEKHKERELQVRQISRIKHKLEMILAYGGECRLCGEEEPLLLCLDHMNNNGNLEKGGQKKRILGAEFYQQLKRLGYPGKNTQLQLLCHNCNALREYQETRIDKAHTIKTTPEIYVAQPYSLTKEQDDELWYQARVLFARLNSSKKE